MAGQWGYYAAITQNGQTGIIAVAPGKKPTSAAGSPVTHATYLGDTSTSAASMTSWLHQFASNYAPGLFEAPGGLGGAVATARSNLNKGATGEGSAVYWQKITPSGAVWDWVPTAVIGTVAAAAVAPFVGAGAAGADAAAAEAGAAGAGAGAAGAGADAAAAGAGADAGAAAAGAAGAAGSAASGLEIAAAIAAVWSFLTAPSSWLRILKYLAGAILIFFGLKELTGVQLPAAAKRVLP